MNANGFKKFEHDRPYGRYGFRQNLPVCIQHHGSGIPPPGTPKPARNNATQAGVAHHH